ncbi:hypothetical protein AB0H42_02785 [Nocardia sp. NPDC050799]|uniref:hypothetical protein n=1 Tax=Nocardia sp. NPDC050799 TaxID=3154842 RepID=UPI0033D0769D
MADFTSPLIVKGADIETVHTRLRHTGAETTSETSMCGLWPDADESTRTAIGGVIAEGWTRLQLLRTYCGRKVVRKCSAAGRTAIAAYTSK